MGMTREQLLQRAQGVGASEVAAILGCSPWSGPLEVYATKLLGQQGIVEEVENEAMEWGTRLEPVVAAKLRQMETGYREIIHLSPEMQESYQDVEVPVLFATPDGYCNLRPKAHELGRPDFDAPAEIKTTNAFAADEWAEEPPLHYQIQMQSQMACTDTREVVYAVLIGGQRFRWGKLARHDSFIDNMLRPKVEEFWRRVTNREPPQPGAASAESDRRALSKLFPKLEVPDLQPVEDLAFVGLDERLEQISAQLKELEEEKKSLQNRIIAAIGSSAGIVIPTGATYKLIDIAGGTVSFERKPTRQLRRSAPKKK